MKKEALVSALLLVSPMSQLQAQDLTNARAQVRIQQQDLIDMQFVSAKTLVGEFWEQDSSGEWGPITLEYNYRISFVKADDEYTYPIDGEWKENTKVMEYEAIVEPVSKDGKKLYGYDGFHYVKRIDENTFKIFDCDSTKTCHPEQYNIVFHIFDTPQGKLMKFKKSSEKDSMFISKSKEYYQVK